MVRVGALGAPSLEAGRSHGLSSCLSSGLSGLPFLSMGRTLPTEGASVGWGGWDPGMPGRQHLLPEKGDQPLACLHLSCICPGLTSAFFFSP